jgi:hypothetical protein
MKKQKNAGGVAAWNARPFAWNTAGIDRSTSSATGETEPTSSRRCRRSIQPTGRGFDTSNCRIASISL